MSVKLSPHVTMDGNTKEAIQLYEKVLDAEVISMTTYGELSGHEGPKALNGSYVFRSSDRTVHPEGR